MAVQGFFSPDRKTRMAGEKENNSAFSVKVKPVSLANNINQYNEQTPSLDYAPDRVGEYIKESETKSYKPEKKDSYVSADSYKPDVKTFDQMFGEGYKKQEEKRTQFYNALNKDLNVGPLGDANLPSGIETKLIGNKYKYVKDGQELTRQEKKELEKDMALRTQLGKFVRDRKFKEMSALGDAERASYEKNMPDPDDRKIDFYTGTVFPGEKVKPFEQRKFDYQRENIRYGTAEDGTPTATISGMTSKYGEDAAKVYGTEQLKKFIAADAKDKYESEYRRDFGPTNLGKPMTSNFVGGVSGLGKESDDFTSRYKSTAGDFDRKKEAEFGISQFAYKTFPKIYKEYKNPGLDPTNPNYYGDDFVSPAFRRNYAQEQADKEAKQFGTGIPSGSDLPAGSFGISTIGKDVAAYNRYQKSRLEESKKEQENKNILQKVGDFVGDTFNKLTGTEAAGAEGINTSATTNISQMGNVSPTVQRAREAVEKSVIRQTGMPSNPKGFSGYSRPSSTSTGRGISRSTSRGQGGRPGSRSRGGTGTGRAGQGSKSSARGARGSAGSRGRGGTGSGSSKSNTGSKRSSRGARRCDIRCKIDISPLIESNLVKDNLAEVAYFVQEIRK